MFGVSLSTLMMIYITVPLVILFAFWFFFEVEKKDFQITYKDQDLMLVCPYCAHVFLENNQEKVVECPSCLNLVNRTEARSDHEARSV